MVKAEDIEFQNSQKVELLDYVKRKRRWAFFWGFLVATVIVCVIFSTSTAEPLYPNKQEHIAHVQVNGVIFDDQYQIDMLAEIEDRDDVKAVIIDINSPGGTVYASETLYHAILKVSETRPVMSVMRDVAASGGYITALAGDKIFAGQTTVTGSVGVIMEIPNVSDLMESIGVETTVVRSSNSKGGISPFRDPTPEELADQQYVLRGMHDWFRGLVSERRNLTGNALSAVSSGGVYTGQQALELGLIDEIGGLDEAREFLESEDETIIDLELVEWKPLYPDMAPQAYIQSISDSLVAKMRDAVIAAQIPYFQAIMK